MTTLDQAEAALDAARQRDSDAHKALADARTELATLEGRIRDGEPSVPAALVAAKAAVDHAEIVASGTDQAVRDAEEAARILRIDAECDEIVRLLRSRGTEVVEALGALEGPLTDFLSATQRFDSAIDWATSLNLGTQDTRPTPRWRSRPYAIPRVDELAVEKCRPMALLARLLQPYLALLGAPSVFREQVKQLADAAPSLPVEP